MNRLPALNADEVIRKLRRAGFQVDHITGAHYIMRHPDGRQTLVPYHGGGISNTESCERSSDKRP
jgi:predicted RNA binding protein YcfA (HicA-like mRNA interferase family)